MVVRWGPMVVRWWSDGHLMLLLYVQKHKKKIGSRFGPMVVRWVVRWVRWVARWVVRWWPDGVARWMVRWVARWVVRWCKWGDVNGGILGIS